MAPSLAPNEDAPSHGDAQEPTYNVARSYKQMRSSHSSTTNLPHSSRSTLYNNSPSASSDRLSTSTAATSIAASSTHSKTTSSKPATVQQTSVQPTSTSSSPLPHPYLPHPPSTSNLDSTTTGRVIAEWREACVPALAAFLHSIPSAAERMARVDALCADDSDLWTGLFAAYYFGHGNELPEREEDHDFDDVEGVEAHAHKRTDGDGDAAAENGDADGEGDRDGNDSDGAVRSREGAGPAVALTPASPDSEDQKREKTLRQKRISAGWKQTPRIVAKQQGVFGALAVGGDLAWSEPASGRKGSRAKNPRAPDEVLVGPKGEGEGEAVPECGCRTCRKAEGNGVREKMKNMVLGRKIGRARARTEGEKDTAGMRRTVNLKDLQEEEDSDDLASLESTDQQDLASRRQGKMSKLRPVRTTPYGSVAP